MGGLGRSGPAEDTNVAKNLDGEALMRLLALGTALLLTASAGSASAAPVQQNHALACTLGGGIALAIKLALVAVNNAQHLGLDTSALRVDSIVIRSADNPNGGQRLAGTPATYSGAIVCTFGAGLLPPAAPYSITGTGASTAIPGVDLFATQTDTFIQYKKPDPAKKTENLLCLNTDANNDCFSIFRMGVAR